MNGLNWAEYLQGVTANLRNSVANWHEPNVPLPALENALRARGHTAEYAHIGVKNERNDEIVESGYLVVDEVFVPIQIVAHMRHYEIIAEDVLIQ